LGGASELRIWRYINLIGIVWYSNYKDNDGVISMNLQHNFTQHKRVYPSIYD